MLIPDWTFTVLSQYIVERFSHERLKASSLSPSKSMHCEGHLGAEEAGDLFAALAARWASGWR